MKHYLNTPYSLLQADISDASGVGCPEKIYLDITEDCNLNCLMCRDDVRVDGRTMPMDMFRRAVDETSPYCRSYSLFLWGEPLILGDFRERVEYVYKYKRSDCNIEISTNGTLLDGDCIEFLRKHDVRVIVSFDGADKEVFEKIRRGASFGQVCENCERLNAAYSGAPLEIAPATYTTIQKNNQSSLVKIAEKTAALGFRRAGFGLLSSPLEYAPGLDEQLRRELCEAYRILADNKMLLELHPAKIGGYVFWGDGYVPADDFIVRTRCDAPFVNSVVRYDGKVCLCCNYGESVGSVYDAAFTDIWWSPAYDKLREAVNDPARMPDACRNCWWVNRL